MCMLFVWGLKCMMILVLGLVWVSVGVVSSVVRKVVSNGCRYFMVGGLGDVGELV